MTGSRVCTRVLVAGCASFVDKKRGERKKFSSMKGLHDTFLTPSLLHTCAYTHKEPRIMAECSLSPFEGQIRVKRIGQLGVRGQCCRSLR